MIELPSSEPIHSLPSNTHSSITFSFSFLILSVFSSHFCSFPAILIHPTFILHPTLLKKRRPDGSRHYNILIPCINMPDGSNKGQSRLRNASLTDPDVISHVRWQNSRRFDDFSTNNSRFAMSLPAHSPQAHGHTSVAEHQVRVVSDAARMQPH